jgi:hypothetical protein
LNTSHTLGQQFLKNFLENKKMVFKIGVKNIGQNEKFESQLVGLACLFHIPVIYRAI